MIAIENLDKTYRLGKIEVPALRDVTLEIEEGGFVAVMGPSGSGKSTLMNIIGCLDVPTSGVYRLEGEEVSRLSENRLAAVRNRRIGFVFQNFNLLTRISALENVVLPLSYGGRRGARALAMEALGRVGLADRAGHKPTELSGGERQRVAIARAIVNEPSILLADEPTGNLDSTTGAEIIKIFHDLGRSGVTLILVTHEREIAETARRIVYMRDGRIVSDERTGKEA
jgi:putative ABC transport system ATP-binding protein